MTMRSQITDWFRAELPGSTLEALLLAAGFSRRRTSLNYIRALPNLVQRFEILFDVHPRYEPGAVAHVLPKFVFESAELGDLVREKMDTDRPGALLPKKPARMLVDAVQNVVPKVSRPATWDWFIVSADDVRTIIENIAAFMRAWGLPFLETYRDFVSLTTGYEAGDDRLHQGRRFFLYVAAAYAQLGQYDKGLEVLEKRFGLPGPRKDYARAFAYIRGLLKQRSGLDRSS